MNNKTKTILRWLPSFIVALQLTISAILKFTNAPFLVQSFQRVGLVEYLNALGCTELLFAALFLTPRTMKIGFLLLTAYFGGAIAVELSHGTFIVPAIILSVIWIAAYLRNPQIFKESKSTSKTSSLQKKIAA